MLLGEFCVVSVAGCTWISRVDGTTATDTKKGAGDDELVGAGTNVSSDCWAGCSTGCCVDVFGGTIGASMVALWRACQFESYEKGCRLMEKENITYRKVRW